MLKNLVVALDGSPVSELALEFGLSMAKAENGTLSICSVADPRLAYGASAPTPLLETMLEEIRSGAQRIVNEATAKAKAAGVPVQEATPSGEPVFEIVRYAESVKADAIIVGTHARSGIDRLLMGSVAEGVLRTATIPVLVVRGAT
jgi:nucleotide-binding universal stress UspA family protein